MKAQKFLSPSKENMSPTKQPFKNADTISELLGYIKTAGLKLPSHLEKCLNPQSSPLLKVIPSEQKSQKQMETIQKLKIKLGDTEFELKKIEEDFAQYKLKSRIEKQKQMKKWEQTLNNLKDSLQFSNEDSALKITKLQQKAENQVRSLKKKHEAELKQQKQKLINDYQQKINALNKVNQRQIKQLKEKQTNEQKKLKEKHQVQVNQLKQNYQAEIKKISLKNKQILDNKQKQFESIYTAIQSEKKTQQKLHEKTRIEASKAKQKLQSEICYERNLKKDLEETLQKKQTQIKALKSQIHSLQVDLILQKQRFEKKQKQHSQQFEKQRAIIENNHKQKVSNILQSHNKQLKKYQKTIHQIQQWKDQQQQVIQNKINQMQIKFQERPSRQQDLDLIQKLRTRLVRKQQEIRLLNNQLKARVMQSENKQETYNKIFTSNTVSKLQKKFLSKDRQQIKSKESLCRKSQTSDINFLLKVYNKLV